jgi:hypothetical protein
MDNQRTGIYERLDMLRMQAAAMESRMNRTEEANRIRLDGIGSNELTDEEHSVIMQIMNDSGKDWSGQLLTLKDMIIGLAEYCIRTRAKTEE